MITDITYFVGENLIPNLTGVDLTVEANIGETVRFINTYEPEYLVKVLGHDLYIEFYNGLANDPVLEKWTALSEKFANSSTLISPVADYVLFNYANYRKSVQGNELVLSERQLFSPQKLVMTWNRMTRHTFEIWEWLCEDEQFETYGFDINREYPFGLINNFGI